MTRKVIVTGGTGFVGSHVVEGYLAAGWSVRALVRNAIKPRWIAGLNIEFATGSLTDVKSLAAAVEGCDAVVHCAAMTKAVDPRDLFSINGDAVGNLVRISREAGVRRFVLCSSQAVTGPSLNGGVATEASPLHPISNYGRSKLRGEEFLREFAGDMEWVILRPPSVIGPRDEQFVPLFRGVVRWGIFPRFGNQPQRYSFVSVHDLARALVLAGDAQSGLGEVYFVAHPDSLEWTSAASHIAGFANRHVRSLKLGKTALSMIGLVGDLQAKLTGKPALLSAEKIREILSPNWVCSSEKIKRNWRFEAEWSQERTLRDTYDAYRAAGWI